MSFEEAASNSKALPIAKKGTAEEATQSSNPESPHATAALKSASNSKEAFYHRLYLLVPLPSPGRLGHTAGLSEIERFQCYEAVAAIELRKQGLVRTMGAAEELIGHGFAQAVMRTKFEGFRYEDAMRVTSSEEVAAFLGIPELVGIANIQPPSIEIRPPPRSMGIFHSKFMCLLSAPAPPDAPQVPLRDRAKIFHASLIQVLKATNLAASDETAFEMIEGKALTVWNKLIDLRLEDAMCIKTHEDVVEFLGIDKLLNVQTVFRDYRDYQNCLLRRLERSRVAGTRRDALKMLVRHAMYFKRRFEVLGQFRRPFKTMVEYDAFLGLDKLSDGAKGGRRHPPELAEGESLSEDAADTVETVLPQEFQGVDLHDFYGKLAVQFWLRNPTSERSAAGAQHDPGDPSSSFQRAAGEAAKQTAGTSAAGGKRKNKKKKKPSSSSSTSQAGHEGNRGTVNGIQLQDHTESGMIMNNLVPITDKELIFTGPNIGTGLSSQDLMADEADLQTGTSAGAGDSLPGGKKKKKKKKKAIMISGVSESEAGSTTDRGRDHDTELEIAISNLQIFGACFH